MEARGVGPLIVATIGALAIGVLAGPSSAAAAAGRVFQYNGPSGCVADTGAEGCATGRALGGAASAAVSPDGDNVYVAASETSSLTTFFRDRRRGRVVQLRGLSGCVSTTGSGGCATGRGLDGAFSVAVSPDGANVYIASQRAVAVFAREPQTGRLAQLAGDRGCLNADGADGCAPARGLDGGTAVAVAPDGRSVYVTGFSSNAVAILARDPDSGALSQAPGVAGCVSDGGAEGCAPGRGIEGPFSVAVSPSGEHVFVIGFLADAVAVFARDGATGALSQLPGASGCAGREASEGCAVVRGMTAPNQIAVAPDGDDVYVASSDSDAVAALQLSLNGVLSQRPGPGGCVSLGGKEGCASAPSLDQAFALAVSVDGRNVYVASRVAVTAFRREPGGSLTRLNCVSDGGVAGCATGRALDGASSVALAPRDDQVYVTAENSDALSTFARDPHGGRVKVRIGNVPRGCAKRRFNVRVRVSSVLPLHRVRVFLNGRRVGASSQPRLTLRIRPSRLGPGRQRLDVKAVDLRGNADRRVAAFRRC